MSSADPERERLFSPAVIAVLGAFVVLMLALAFPRVKLEARLLGGVSADSLAIAYLEAWLRVDPDNADVLSELTREYLKGQRTADAAHVIDRLARSHDPGARQTALAIRVSLAQQQLYALGPADPARGARIAELDALLREAARYAWNREQLEALARKARGLNDGALAGHFYEQLVALDPLHAKDWRVAQAEVLLGSGHYREAADAWFAAQAGALALGERRTLFLAGLRALQAGNLLPQALDAANQHIGGLGDDPETLRYLAKLAMAAGRPDVAEIYVKRLLKLSLSRPRDDADGRPRLAFASMRRYGDVRAMRIARAGARFVRIAWPAQEAQSGPGADSGALRVAAAQRAVAAGGTRANGAPVRPDTYGAVPPNTADEDLAYSVFLANGDVANAQRVAQRALDKAPESALWRARLAQVAEWNHQPDVALRNWLALAQSRGDDASWRQVARLAPGVNDVAAVLAVSVYQSNRDPDNLELLDAAVDAYERAADPAGGLSFLAGRERGAIRQAAMERYAALAERKGDDDLALHTWQQLEREYGPNAAYGYKIATMLYARTEFDAAFAAMQQVQQAASATDADFWRFYALVASIGQRRDAQNQANRRLLGTRALDTDDYDVMIGFYGDSPVDAGRLAEMAYHKGGRIRMLTVAVYNYQRARAWGRLAALLDSLSPEQRTSAGQSAAFLLVRARYRQTIGDIAGASSDVRRAATLAPDDSEARAAYLWSLVDRGTTAELRRALRRFAADAETDPSLWAPYGAASMRLGEGRQALHYFHKQAATSLADPLWRLTWADALELNGRLDDAWRVRRQVWSEMAERRRTATQQAALPSETALELRGRMVALSQLFASGDRSRAVLIDMLRADRAQAASASAGGSASELGNLSELDKLPPVRQQALRDEQARYSSIAREAVLGWAQTAGESELERAWLEKQYIDRSTRPVYAQAQLAIDDGDVNALARLLDSLPDQIPRQNKVDAEVLTGRYGAAQSDAFDSMTRLPDDEVMQSQLREQLLRSAQAVAAALRYVDQGPLRFTEASLTGGLRLAPSQSLQLRYMQREQSVDGTSLAYAPEYDRLFEAIYRHAGQYDDESVTLGRRDALEDFTTARIEGRYIGSPALTLSYAFGYDQAATETAQLQVGGTKDMASVGFDYRFDSHWFVDGRDEYARFHGQDRSFLGGGNLVDFNVGFKIRADYPDYTIRAVFSHGQYNATGTPGNALRVLLPAGTPFDAASFMPQTFTQGGLLFSFGDDLPENDSKGWRPMFSAGPLRDSRAGWSGQAMLGIAGSVFGADQALLYAAYQGVSSTRSTSVKEVGVRYRWMY